MKNASSAESGFFESSVSADEEIPERKLVYTEEFKAMIREYSDKNPKEQQGLIATFMDIEDELKEMLAEGKAGIGHSIEMNGLKVTILNEGGSTDGPHIGFVGAYFKVEAGEHAFFVKNIPGYFDNEKTLGAHEFESARRAHEILKDVQDAEVVEFQLGYHEDSHDTYYVSKWVDGTPLDLYLNRLKLIELTSNDAVAAAEAHAESEVLETRFWRIKDRLDDDFADVNEHNVLYVPETGKFVFFDIHLKQVQE